MMQALTQRASTLQLNQTSSQPLGMKEARYERILNTVKNRQLDLCVILENVHDPHNIGAVLRSCESVGVCEIFVLYSDNKNKVENISLGKKTSSGSRKWVDLHFYEDTEACFKHIKSKYKNIYATHLGKDAQSLHALDLTESVALMFGNEHDGLSEEALAHANGNFIIPQYGMVQSLNISVACAVSLYEALRQRQAKGLYGKEPEQWNQNRKDLLEDYMDRHISKYNPIQSKKIK